MWLLDGSLLGGIVCVVLAAVYEAIALAGAGSLVGQPNMPTVSAIVQKWTHANSFIAALIFYVVLAALAALFGHFLSWF